jgi:hypothetical protein
MGIKISSLPNNTLPYTGSEEIPLVQSGQTRAGTLSSFVNYLSGALLSDSELRALSGNWQNTYTTVTANSAKWNSTYTTVTANSANWQNTYTTFKANSANYAVKNATNTFTSNQIFNTGIQVGTSTLLKQISEPNTFALGADTGINAGVNSDFFEYNILIGAGAGNQTGSDNGTATDVISIGNNAGVDVGYGVYGDAANVINIGLNAGISTGYNNYNGLLNTTNIISIGTNAGEYIGSGDNSGDGEASSVVAIGASAGSRLGSANNASGYAAYASQIIAIGDNAGSYAGAASSDANGSIQNAILLGTEAGSYAGVGGGVVGVENGDVQDLIAIGRSAGYQSGNGGSGLSYDNIYIGREAGYQSGYSNNNIFLGLSSGYNKQGSRNTFIGDLTNTSPTTTTSLSGCIAIGYGATPTARNTIAIGSASTPLSVVPGRSTYQQLSSLKIMINGTYYTIPLFS